MTREEFNHWLDHHSIAFPEVAAWLGEHERLEELLSMWSQTLARVTQADAMQCTSKMLSGQVKHPNKFEMSRLPAVVIESCPVSLIPASELAGKKYNPWTGEIS